MSLLVEGHRQVVVLGHQGGLEDPVNGLDPVSSLHLGLGGELICPVRCVHDEAEPLLSEARAKTGNNQVARAGVTQEDLTLKQEDYLDWSLRRKGLSPWHRHRAPLRDT